MEFFGSRPLDRRNFRLKAKATGVNAEATGVNAEVPGVKEEAIPGLVHSQASIGSTAAARRAGTNDTSSETTASNADTPSRMR